MLTKFHHRGIESIMGCANMSSMEKNWVNGVGMFSKSFYRGFVGGFTSPASIFLGSKIKRPAEFDGSVERAWREVGRNLSDVTNAYGESIGKAPARTKKRRTHAA
jgi:hypothetical protein